jgi:hypothetical protein
MKLSSIIVSQVIVLGKVTGPGGGVVYGLNLSKAYEERYGFLQAPRMLSDYDLSKGVTFLHGFFNNRVIDKFQVFSNGLVVEAKLDTDDCDRFLDDVFKWVSERGGIEFTPSEPVTRHYVSQLEIQSNLELAHFFPRLAPLGRQIAEILRGYGQMVPDYAVSGLSFGVSPNDVAGFRFEGREGANVPRGTFFSQARMRTSDHLRILDVMESTIRTSAS